MIYHSYMSNNSYEEEIQAPELTSGQHLEDSELARVVAKAYGWTIEEGVRFKDKNKKLVGKDIAQAAAAMRELKWFYDPTIPSVGIDWKIMPHTGDDEGSIQAADAIRKLLDQEGMYWFYNNDNNRPEWRARDGYTPEQVQDGFRNKSK